MHKTSSSKFILPKVQLKPYQSSAKKRITPKMTYYVIYFILFLSLCNLHSAKSSSTSISIHLGINFALMASDKQECNQFVRFLNAVLGGIIAFIIGRTVEKCYDHFQRYRSANTAIPNAGGDDIRALDDPDNTLYLPVHNTPVTSPGHAISDMDRDIKNSVACKEGLQNRGATRPWNGSV